MEQKQEVEITMNLAVKANQATWALLSKKDRKPMDNVEMLTRAFGQLYLWDLVGTDLNRARAHWLVSRVFCELPQGVMAQKHAELCGLLTGAATEREDFDLAYALEALARANACLGNFEKARTLKLEANKAGLLIKDEESRLLFLEDLKREPWFVHQETLNNPPLA